MKKTKILLIKVLAKDVKENDEKDFQKNTKSVTVERKNRKKQAKRISNISHKAK